MRKIARIGLYGGVVAIALALSKVHARWIAPEPYSWHSSDRFAWSLCYMAVLIVAEYGVGLPDLLASRRAVFLAAIGAPAAGAGVMSLIQLGTGDALLPRFVVFGTALILVPWSYAWSRIAQTGRRRDEDRDRVLFVGSPDAALVLADDLSDASMERPAMLVARLDIAEACGGGQDDHPIGRSAKEDRATLVVLDHDAQAEYVVIAQVADLHEEGIRVRSLSGFYEEWLGKLPVSELERASLLFDIGEVHRARYARIKRLLDVPLACVGLVALAVAFPIVIVGNLIANRGPLFYRQERVGMRGRRFRIVKFRTMREASDVSSDWTTDRDPRVTPFGGFLRRTHLDELPQMWNILRGELSMVGPRPEQPRYVQELSEKLPFYNLRHLVHPGLTGWAQVKYGYAGDETDALQKLQYEFFYLRHQSLRLDLRTIARTVRSVIGRAGR